MSDIDLSHYFSKEEFDKIMEIAKIISNHNGTLYLVGGSVRDIILDAIPHDYDFCVVGITSNIFETIFPNAIKQGKSFPVYILNQHEFALARKESKIGSKHTDFIFLTDPNISIYEDLARRDLTINSMAIHVLSQELVDPFHGIEDIKNKILKMTSPAFSEDPLRVYRVARFSAQLDFRVEPSTLEIMKVMKNELSNLSVERVFTEFRKALLSPYPMNFLKILRECNCLDIHFKEVSDLIDIPQPLKYHPEGDVYHHTLEVLERVSQITSDELTRFGAFVHDFGKAVTPKDNWPHHYDHDKLGVPIIKAFCQKLKMPNSYLKAGCLASSEHMLAGIYHQLKPGTKIDFLEKVYKSKSLSLRGLEILANSDTKKESTVCFAEIGEKIMKNIKLNDDDMLKISQANYQSQQQKIKMTKQLLREKRIKYLLELEKQEMKSS